METQPAKATAVKATALNLAQALGFVVLGVAIGAGTYIGETDDAPGAAVLGLLLAIGAIAFGARTA
jgi:hypothetical protein